MKATDLSSSLERFSIFKPKKLLFTRIDETHTYGPILNEVARSGKPLSFLCGGQQIPEDIEIPNRRRILDLLLGEICGRAAAAAA
jgi:flagellar biosynthesis protein FlhF